ncbi:MAG: DNRLRE domain-containing protein [Deltaproteobacteria bacterium]|nr:DNRLRE domain-containing protein [Deltaproteobacteria bacterium]
MRSSTLVVCFFAVLGFCITLAASSCGDDDDVETLSESSIRTSHSGGGSWKLKIAKTSTFALAKASLLSEMPKTDDEDEYMRVDRVERDLLSLLDVACKELEIDPNDLFEQDVETLLYIMISGGEFEINGKGLLVQKLFKDQDEIDTSPIDGYRRAVSDSSSESQDYDSTVSQNNSSTNYCNESLLTVGNYPGLGNYYVYLKNGSGLTCPGGTITNAQLRVYGWQNTESRNVAVCRALASWDECSVTWSNKPSYTSCQNSNFSSGTGYRYLEADAAVSALCPSSPSSYRGFVVTTGTGPDGYQSFYSRENGSYWVYLVLTYDTCEPNACDDGNPCTTDSYDGCHCQHTNNSNSCDDGQYCTINDHCSGGSCVSGGSRNCANANYCDGVEYCNEGTNSCVSPGNPCSDDGQYCNGTESCNEGGDSCQHSGNPCPDNGQYCDGPESCNEGTNSCDSPDPCGDDGQFCNGAEGCNETINQCTHAGDPCDAGETCNEPTDQCFDCVSDGDCNDGNACTDDACISNTCQHTNNTNSCDDGLYCTVNDQCGGGSCSGTARDCDDGLFCTGVESCSELLNQCTAGNSPCGAEQQCLEDSDQCVQCLSATDCDDTNPCTDDSCSVSGSCEHANNSAACDDSNLCTESDSCSAGNCIGTPKECTEGEMCNDATGNCEPAADDDTADDDTDDDVDDDTDDDSADDDADDDSDDDSGDDDSLDDDAADDDDDDDDDDGGSCGC